MFRGASVGVNVGMPQRAGGGQTLRYNRHEEMKFDVYTYYTPKISFEASKKAPVCGEG